MQLVSVKVLIYGEIDDDAEALRLFNALYGNERMFENIDFDYDAGNIETVVTLKTYKSVEISAMIVQDFLNYYMINTYIRARPDFD